MHAKGTVMRPDYRFKKHAIAAVVVASLYATPVLAETQFTYQGRLTDGNGPVTDTCDLQFELYDAQTNGTLQDTATLTGVAVEDGLFTTSVDFGDKFDGSARYLEVGVKCSGETAYTTLGSRQKLTASPMAVYANKAGSANSADSVAWGGVTSKPTWSCSAGQYVQGIDASSGGVSCVTDKFEADTNTTYTAGTGLALSGTEFSLDKDGPRLAIVSQDSGHYADPAAAMDSLGSWCGTPSATAPCLIRVLPGEYSLSSDLAMQSYVDIAGAGAGVTVLTTADGVTINGAANAALRDLTVEESGGSAAFTNGAGADSDDAATLDGVHLRGDSGTVLQNTGATKVKNAEIRGDIDNTGSNLYMADSLFTGTNTGNAGADDGNCVGVYDGSFGTPTDICSGS